MENYNTQQNGLVQQQNNDTEGVDISLRTIWKFLQCKNYTTIVKHMIIGKIDKMISLQSIGKL